MSVWPIHISQDDFLETTLVFVMDQQLQEKKIRQNRYNKCIADIPMAKTYAGTTSIRSL